MLRRCTSVVALLLALSFVFTMGCAGTKVVSTPVEEGYFPTHCAVGKVAIHYDGSLDLQKMRKMVVQKMERSFRKQGIPFVPLKKMETMGVAPENLVLVDLSITFMSDMRGMTERQDARVEFTAKRQQDNAVWLEGSVSSTDEMVSQAAAVDYDNAVKLATLGVAKRIKEKLN